MKILFISNRYFSIANSRKKIIKSLIDKGHQVVVVASFDDYLEEVQQISETRLNCRNCRFPTSISALRSFLPLKKILKEEVPDIVHAFNPVPVFFSAFLKNTYKYKLMVTITGLGAPYGQNSKSIILYDRLYKYAFKKAEQTIFQNKEDYQYFENSLSSEILTKFDVITGSGVDTERFKILDSRSKNNKTFNVLFIARLIKHKGIDTVLKLSEELLNEDIKINIFGEYIPEHTYSISEKEFNKIKNAKNIEFRGFVKNIEREFEKNDILICCSSKGEGLPRVVLEASASGLPVVAYNASGVNEGVVDNETGHLIPKFDTDLFKDKIIALKNDRNKYLRMSQKAREFIVENYSQEKILDKYVQKYNDIIVEK